MNLEEATNQFALRLYDWSIADFRREADEDFPIMSLVGLNNRFVAAFIAFMRETDEDTRSSLLTDLPLVTHVKASRLRGQTFSQTDERAFNEAFAKCVEIREHWLPPLVTADRRMPDFEPVDLEHCLATVSESLSDVFGRPSRRRNRVRAERWFGDWKLTTEFWFYKPDTFLFCEYQFVRKDGKPITGHFSEYPRNPFMFYGVTSTKAFVPSEKDGESMGKAIVRVAEHFVSQAEPLFAGLDVND